MGALGISLPLSVFFDLSYLPVLIHGRFGLHFLFPYLFSPRGVMIKCLHVQFINSLAAFLYRIVTHRQLCFLLISGIINLRMLLIEVYQMYSYFDCALGTLSVLFSIYFVLKKYI